ncbi:hypothetical protein GCM10020229_27500 [Kitasatospora albolonga]|uniref:hypothetical protein n=1 Tax=Kitasatospora albolonga TaxID=68173 RepID=UPI003385CCBA
MFAGNRYGTPRAAVLEKLASGKPVLLEIDLQAPGRSGSRCPRPSWSPRPASWGELVRRLTGRGTEPQDVIEPAGGAKVELAAEPEFDNTLVNHSVEQVSAECTCSV